MNTKITFLINTGVKQMTRVTVPELKKYYFVYIYNYCDSFRFMDKRLSIQVNCNRKITGIMRGFDAFMNIVLDETMEECKTGNLPMGTVVRLLIICDYSYFFLNAIFI